MVQKLLDFVWCALEKEVGLEVIRYLLAVHYAKLNEQGRTEIITQAGNTLSKATLFVQTNQLWIL